MIAIRALTAPLPPGPFDALIATSPRAIVALGDGDRAPARGPAALCRRRARGAGGARGGVGARRRAGARRGGARRAADRLARAGRAAALSRWPRPQARARSGARRRRSSHRRGRALCRARRAKPGAPSEAEAVAGCAAALHYSRRSAALAVALAERAGVAERFGRWRMSAFPPPSPRRSRPLARAGSSRRRAQRSAADRGAGTGARRARGELSGGGFHPAAARL